MNVEGPFEAELSPLAQFQFLTVCVWFAEILMLIGVMQYHHQGHGFDSRWMVPFIHLVPWLIGFQERRKLIEHDTRIKTGSRGNEIGILSITRHLWITYFVLVSVELMLFFGW